MKKTAAEIAGRILRKVTSDPYQQGSGTLSGRKSHMIPMSITNYFKSTNHPGLALGYGESKDGSQTGFSLVDAKTGDSYGYVTLTHSEEDPTMAEVTGLYVNPEHRRKGYGSILAEAAREMHPDKFLWVKPDPYKDRTVTSAHIAKVYQKAGYLPHPKLPDIYTS